MTAVSTLPSTRRRWPVSLAFCAVMVAVCGSALAQPPGPPGEQFKVVTFVEGLKNPWSMAWLPNGDMLVTERGGALRIVRGGKLLPDPIAGVPKVRAQGQGGLQEVGRASEVRAEPLHLSELLEAERRTARRARRPSSRAKFENDKLVRRQGDLRSQGVDRHAGPLRRAHRVRQGRLPVHVGRRPHGRAVRRPKGMDPTKLEDASGAAPRATTRARSCG